MHALRLTCPECHMPSMLECQAGGSYHQFTLTLITQVCTCDPFHAWEDVWEQAREVIFEEGGID